MIKKLSLILITIFIFIFSAPINSADADYAIDIDQTYTLTLTGANITETISITNLSDLTYPTDYSTLLYSDQLKSVSLVDAYNQPVNFDQTPIAGTTKINLHLPQPIVGKNKTQTYRLEYFSPEIRPDPHSAQYFIPKNQTPSENVTTTIIIPHQICPQPLVFPTNLNLDRQQSFSRLKFNQSAINQAVTVLCQPKRIVNVTLTYQLFNPTINPAETQITLPPDTSYQRVVFHSITPAPQSQITDSDGNRIANYHLQPKQNLSVTALASIEITNAQQLLPHPNINTKLLTQDQPHWPASHHQIKQLIKQLPSPQAIYDYLISHAQYNPDQFDQFANRHGGLIVIQDPKNLTAQDFTDAFITLCRAAGIPSRRLVSFVPSTNQKLYPHEYPDQNFHVYPEWYDANSKTWIAVDPFWQVINPFQNFLPVTDQFRITLAINGTNDSQPYPANSVIISEASEFTLPPPQLTATLKNDPFDRLFTRHTNLIITNHSNYALYQEPIQVYAGDNPIKSLILDRLDINESRIIPLTINTNQSLTIDTRYGPIPIKQTYISLTPTITFTAILVTIAGVFAVISGRLLVSRRKR